MDSNLEKYVEWLIPDLKLGRCGLLSFSRAETELKVILNDSLVEFVEIELLFDLRDVVGFRLSNDSYSWRSDSERTRRKDYSLFKVENSKYIDWFKAETYGAADLEGVVHFCLLLADECLDIVSFSDPEVHIRNQK